MINLKNKKHVLFDFDGTIADTSEGIFKAARHIVEDFGYKSIAESEYRRMIGPPLRWSFKEVFGFPDEKIEEAMSLYRKYYDEHTLFDCKIYDGMEELLKSLCENERKVYVATSKPEILAEKILEHFNLRKYFTLVCGSNINETNSKKADVIRRVLKTANIEDLSSAIMIGDRLYDVEGAKEVGMDCIGALFGFGSEKELLDAGAAAVSASALDIKSLLL